MDQTGPGSGQTSFQEREGTAQEIGRLADEVAARDAAVGTLLRRLAEAVRQRKPDEVRGYTSVIDPRAIAELLVGGRSTLFALLEVARNVLVFAPIAVTWYGLSTASYAYGKLLGEKPDLVTRPFLLLWEEGFDGARAVINFSTLAAIDASLIGLLIVLSFVVHFRADIRDAATRTRILLKESEIRGLLGHAASVVAMSLGEGESEELLDQMAAEERRIYERAMEREERLLELEEAIRDLREAAGELARAADSINEAQRVRRAL